MDTGQAVEVTVFSSESVEYYTPARYIAAARAVMGGIDLDPASCALAQETVQAGEYYTKEDNGLAQPWYGRVWLNPPYGKIGNRSSQGVWARRLESEYVAGNVTQGILLVKAAVGYSWFERLWDNWPVGFARERLAFDQPGDDDNGKSKQGSAFFYFGPSVDRFATVFKEFCRIVRPRDQMGRRSALVIQPALGLYERAN